MFQTTNQDWLILGHRRLLHLTCGKNITNWKAIPQEGSRDS